MVLHGGGVNQREIRRIANVRAALMIDSCLNYGWEPDDLIEEIGQENFEKVKEEVFTIAEELRDRIGPAVGSKIQSLREEIEKQGGIWDGQRAEQVYHALGFHCTRERAGANLRMVSEYYPGLLTVVSGKRNTWTAS